MLTQESTSGTPAEHSNRPQNPFALWIQDIRRYHEIILFRTYASLKAETEKAYLGYIWWFLEPVVNTILFYTIFAIFLKHQSANYAMFLIVGFVIWEWFQSAVSFSLPSIGSKATLLQLIYLPKFIFPMCSILSSSWKFLCVLVVLMGYMWIEGFPPNTAYLALPLLLIIQLILIVAFSFPCAIVYPLYPDSQIFIQTFLRGLMLVSGIFFEGKTLKGDVSFWFYINPMAHLIEMYRDIFMHGKFPDISSLAYSFAFSITLMIFSFWLMRRVDRVMPKLLNRD